MDPEEEKHAVNELCEEIMAKMIASGDRDRYRNTSIYLSISLSHIIHPVFLIPHGIYNIYLLLLSIMDMDS